MWALLEEEPPESCRSIPTLGAAGGQWEEEETRRGGEGGEETEDRSRGGRRRRRRRRGGRSHVSISVLPLVKSSLQESRTPVGTKPS